MQGQAPTAGTAIASLLSTQPQAVLAAGTSLVSNGGYSVLSQNTSIWPPLAGGPLASLVDQRPQAVVLPGNGARVVATGTKLISLSTSGSSTSYNATTITIGYNLTVATGDVIVASCAITPNTGAITGLVNASGTAVFGPTTVLPKITNGSLSYTVAWCRVTTGGTMQLRANGSGITYGTMAGAAYHGAAGVRNTGIISTGTASAMIGSLVTQYDQSWVAICCGSWQTTTQTYTVGPATQGSIMGNYAGATSNYVVTGIGTNGGN